MRHDVAWGINIGVGRERGDHHGRVTCMKHRHVTKEANTNYLFCRLKSSNLGQFGNEWNTEHVECTYPSQESHSRGGKA